MFAPAKDGAMDLMDLRYLSIVVESGTFSGAAESLGVKPSTISRRIIARCLGRWGSSHTFAFT